MIRSPAARSARPVSVMSTMQSAMSGILASLAPYDRRTSASMPLLGEVPRGQLGVLGVTRDALRAGPRPAATGESAATATTTWTGLEVALRVPQLAEADDLAAGLLDPVAAGDAEVEQPLGDVHRDLLRAQDADLGDARVVDRRPVVDRRRADDGEVGGLEQLERGLLQRALGQHQPQHARRGYARSTALQCVGRRFAGQQAQGVRAAMSRIAPSCSTQPFGRARRVADRSPARDAGDAPRQAAERADQPHRLGQARRLALDHRPRALGRLVARSEAGAAGRDDQAGEAVRSSRAALSATLSAPSAVDPVLDDVVAGGGQLLDERRAAGVLAGAVERRRR